MKVISLVIVLLTVVGSGFAKVDLAPDQIQLLIDSLQKTHQLPGIQVSIRDTDAHQSWDFSTGYSDKKTSAPLETHHLMQIGSTTKSFIASLTLLLEADSEKGKARS